MDFDPTWRTRQARYWVDHFTKRLAQEVQSVYPRIEDASDEEDRQRLIALASSCLSALRSQFESMAVVRDSKLTVTGDLLVPAALGAVGACCLAASPAWARILHPPERPALFVMSCLSCTTMLLAAARLVNLGRVQAARRAAAVDLQDFLSAVELEEQKLNQLKNL